MTVQSPVPVGADGILKVAILAVGGQGGGVLTGWIEDVARANGWVAQATSVAGVSQRTGATIYYIEMARAREDGRVPVFALKPAAGDVDVMIAAEMMEAGRAILRGFVTPDRTTLIASTHRALAVSEKSVPGDGIASSDEVLAAAEVAARRLIAADYEALAVANGSVISAALPPAVAGMAGPGLRKVVDFQDLAYGAEYLDRLDRILARDDPARGHALSREAAKHVANAMAYDDVIRVADLKTRAPRFDRIRAEMGVGEGRLLRLTEFFHPRAEEIAGLLPAAMGSRVQASPRWMARLDRWFNRGRRLRSDGLWAFGMLYLVGGLRFWRRRTLRHAEEVAHLDRWLAVAMGYLPGDYDLAVEVIRCRRLVKGYSDTHARGLSKFDRVLAAIVLVAGRADAADWARRLCEAALKDEEGRALDGAILTVRSFAEGAHQP
jgi:Pyruvate/2-oxoacid:ferredoxin oxidoreductase gamma subunit